MTETVEDRRCDGGCGARLMTEAEARKGTRPGWRGHRGRGLCRMCYERHERGSRPGLSGARRVQIEQAIAVRGLAGAAEWCDATTAEVLEVWDRMEAILAEDAQS